MRFGLALATAVAILSAPAHADPQILVQRDVSLRMALTIAGTALAECGINASVSGTVTDRSAHPGPNVPRGDLSDDRAREDASYRIRTTFSHQRGGYELTDLPIGDYRVVAVLHFHVMWTDPPSSIAYGASSER